MKSTFKKIILFVAIIAVIIIVAVLVFGKNNTNKDLLQNGGTLSTTQNPTNSTQSANFLQSLSQVKSITLDTTFFTGKAYQKLIDYSTPIVLEDQRLIGRPNPFAPLGSDSVFNQPDSSVTDPTILDSKDLNTTNSAVQNTTTKVETGTAKKTR